MPNRFKDYELEIDGNNNNENPMVHEQIDGHTNNVSFKTDCIHTWKQVILAHFEADQVKVIKDDTQVTVSKVSLNEGQGHASLSVKINIYNTGSVVIQGSKCQVFYNKYFNILKELVHNFQDTQDTSQSEDNFQDIQDISQTEETNFKTVKSPDVGIRTPTVSTPKERVAQHQETLQVKLTSIHSINHKFCIRCKKKSWTTLHQQLVGK